MSINQPPTTPPADSKTDPPADSKTDPPAGTSPPGPNGDPGPVPYDRFKAINDEKKFLEKTLADLQAKLKQQEDVDKTELEKLTGEFNTLKASLELERQARLRLEIASRRGIPADLAGRLQGATAEELEADADRLRAWLKPADGPGNPPPSRPGDARPTGFDLAGKTPEEIRTAYRDGKVKLTS